jgi:hypothetical protein
MYVCNLVGIIVIGNNNDKIQKKEESKRVKSTSMTELG